MDMKRDPHLETLKAELQKVRMECDRLLKENAYLKTLLDLNNIERETSILSVNKQNLLVKDNKSNIVTNYSTPESKIALYRSYFRGREDVYPTRWESKAGKSGYSPVCANEWVKDICKKPLIKCAECKHRLFLPLADEVIYDHLAGKHTVGLYPLLLDETCWFLAIDFDKTTWMEDVSAILETCRELDIPVAVERSRSGNGAHIWIFFDTPISASIARNLGSIILSHTMEKRYQIGLDSYDRLFPNQDTVPKGGFGNLIALPLQGNDRKNGNTLFVDQYFQPYEDQWYFLFAVRKMNKNEVQDIVKRMAATYKIVSEPTEVVKDEFQSKDISINVIQKQVMQKNTNSFPASVQIIQDNLLYFKKQDLSNSLTNQLIQIASFQNPEFYKLQRLRLSTNGIPRVINCSEDYPDHIGIPRGCLDKVMEVLTSNHIKVEMIDRRVQGLQIDVNFQGELRPIQQEAADALLASDIGVLSATTAFGKTVLAAYLIASRKVNTLVLVHRKQLMEQWKERLSTFLDIPSNSIGFIGGGKDKRTGIVDIGIIQSIGHGGAIKEFVKEYGQVIIDECHHVSAFSFEQVLKQVKARYVNGLTATPTRKDGLHPIIMMQCGNICFKVDAKSQAASRPFEHIVIPRFTNFEDTSKDNSSIQEIYSSLLLDEQRNDMIFDDIMQALEEGRSPILLTERTSHVDYFANRLKGFAKNIIVFQGGLGKKQMKALSEKMASIPEIEERIIIATGRYIGEGFDDSRLDTLFLTMPISWKGTLQQYAGRLHRLHDLKKDVRIYDYVDSQVPMLKKMYEKRENGYKAMRYIMKEIEELRNQKSFKQLTFY